MFRRRPDGSLSRDVSAVRRFMPFISERRNHSLVYFSQEVDVENALRFIEERNRERPADRPITFFHLILRGIARVLHQRPRLNRFVMGGRLWDRDGIWITFSAKQRFDDSAPIITVKLHVDPAASLESTVDQVHAMLSGRRGGERDMSDSEIDWLLKLPPWMVRLVMRVVHRIDSVGLLPARMIHSDPLYASAFVANLGSVGLEAGYHHLWEHGNIPIFCVIGKLFTAPDNHRRVVLKFSYDERVEDGLYCARSLNLMRDWLENPESL